MEELQTQVDAATAEQQQSDTTPIVEVVNWYPQLQAARDAAAAPEQAAAAAERMVCALQLQLQVGMRLQLLC